MIPKSSTGWRASFRGARLAFFLFDVLTQFAKLARQRGDSAAADRYIAHSVRLREQIEANSWDGDWYRRAYFDDGTPLGSNRNEECQIDSLPQSWSVLSGAGSPERSKLAMQAVDRRLVHRDDRQIHLFDPPSTSHRSIPATSKGISAASKLPMQPRREN